MPIRYNRSGMTNQETFNDNVVSKFPKDEYVLIREAGRGFPDGAVFFALPRATIPSTLKDPSSKDSEFEVLRNKLVAVKIVAEEKDLIQEVDNLKHIHSGSGLDLYTNIHSRFPRVAAHGPNWLELSAFEPGLTLEDFLEYSDKFVSNTGGLPAQFIAHVFLDLLRTLEFLHEECGIAHCDLHSGNILIDITNIRDRSKFPRSEFPGLVLIDFGTSTRRNTDKAEDVLTFCSVIGEAAYANRAGPERKTMKELRDFMMQVKAFDNKENHTLEDIKGRFEGRLLECRIGVNEDIVGQVVDLMIEAVGSKGKEISLQQLRTALEDSV